MSKLEELLLGCASKTEIPYIETSVPELLADIRAYIETRFGPLMREVGIEALAACSESFRQAVARAKEE